MRLLSALLGAVVVVATTSSVLRTLVVPRGLRSRLTSAVTAVCLGLARTLARPVRRYETRDRVLAYAAPLSVVVLFLAWLASYLVGYALILHGLSGLPATVSLREAGSSLFTLGFASTDRGRLTFVDFLAAVTGPAVTSLLIGYLATVYAAYQRRETDVTMLESRAGEPNWGPEILARHAAASTVGNLEDLWAGWERWAADVSESHTNYPVLLHVRSSRPLRNWLVGLLAVMDAAALQLAVAPSLPQGRARIAVRMGFVCLRDIAKVERIPFDPDPDPDSPITLTFQEFAGAYERVRRTGFPVERSAEDAWPHFRGWRVNYETLAHRLLARIDAVPGRWTGPRRYPDAEVEPRTPTNREPGGRIGPPEVPPVA